MPYFIPNVPGRFATMDEALAAAAPKPRRPLVVPAAKDKPAKKAPEAPKEG